jgi:osmotically-inducible protein OsmY
MTIKSDGQIKQELERELRWDTRVEETEVGVTVNQGVVALTGTVSSYAKKMAAQEAAHRVAGVLDVANDLQVKVPGSLSRTDMEVAQAVRHGLQWDVLVPDQRISSTVSDGWVTLEGSVDNLREREDAGRTVRFLRGVKGVHNKLIVSAQEIEPEEVRAVIEEALERQAEREASRIRVTVDNGAVTLAGEVRSYAEKRAILGAASHALGIRVVHDHLRISPY